MRARSAHPGRQSAVRVALGATVIAAVGVAVAGVVLDRQQRGSHTAGVDAQLGALLNKISHGQPDATAIAAQLEGNLGLALGNSPAPTKPGVPVSDTKPSVVTAAWVLDVSGRVLGATPLAPPPPADVATAGYPRDADVEGRPYRFDSLDVPGGRLIAATDAGADASGLPLPSSIGVAAAVLAGVFAATLIVGLRAVAPVERARRVQLEFTADASHELRTPLSVIEAEASLVLRDPAAEDPVAVVERIAREGRRLRAIVDGLLWLARNDGEPDGGPAIDADLAELAAAAVVRFTPIAEHGGVRLRLERAGEEPALLRAPDGWLERLLGVLLDNACRVTPSGGDVVVRVTATSGRVSLSVDDSGPGIPEGERPRVVERFHRLDGIGGGSGLGLAIGDAVVRGTGGRWSIGTAPEGGAAVGCSWPAMAVSRGLFGAGRRRPGLGVDGRGRVSDRPPAP